MLPVCRGCLKPLNKDEKRALEQVITTMNNTIAAIEKEA